MLTQNLSDFWEKLYSKQENTWDLGTVTPALLEYFKHSTCPKEGRVLVPGAGFGHDALAWAERGHETLAVDFCPTAVDALEMLSRKNKNLSIVDADLFELDPKDHGLFDIVYDYVTFASVHPGRRDEYFEVWTKMLKDDGLILFFLYPIDNHSNPMQGPPHCTSEGELLARMDGIFDVEQRIKPTNSVPQREGKEEIWLLRKAIG
jgi:methyl halide transferase